MREIKFRGKCEQGYDYSNGDGWVYGSLLQKGDSCAIVRTEDIDLSTKTDDGYSFVEDFGCIPVISNTVGRFTGLKDKKGKEIYEGDILASLDSPHRYVVTYHRGCFILLSIEDYQLNIISLNQSLMISGAIPSYGISFNYNEIIGNIHDNPEL